jgi:hypothetical protein
LFVGKKRLPLEKDFQLMKRFLFLIGLVLWSVSAYGQFAGDWSQGDLSRKGAGIAVKGEKLDHESVRALLTQVGGQEMVDSWEKYARQRGWGIGLTAGGYTLAVAGLAYGGVYLMAGVVGTIFAAIGGQEAVDKLWDDMGPRVYIGGGAMLAGLAAGTTGIVLRCVGNRNMRRMVEACDAAGLPPAAELTFGPAPSGMGLVLRF